MHYHWAVWRETNQLETLLTYLQHFLQVQSSSKYKNSMYSLCIWMMIVPVKIVVYTLVSHLHLYYWGVFKGSTVPTQLYKFVPNNGYSCGRKITFACKIKTKAFLIKFSITFRSSLSAQCMIIFLCFLFYGWIFTKTFVWILTANTTLPVLKTNYPPSIPRNITIDSFDWYFSTDIFRKKKPP